MIDRRAFLSRLGFGTVAAAAAATGLLDVEQLLWIPGEKTIFVPEPSTIAPLSLDLARGDVFVIDGVYALNPRTGKPTTMLQQFVITSDVDSGFTLDVAKIYPPILPSGPYRNVSSSPVQKNQVDGRQVRPLSIGKEIPTQVS